MIRDRIKYIRLKYLPPIFGVIGILLLALCVLLFKLMENTEKLPALSETGIHTPQSMIFMPTMVVAGLTIILFGWSMLVHQNSDMIVNKLVKLQRCCCIPLQYINVVRILLQMLSGFSLIFVGIVPLSNPENNISAVKASTESFIHLISAGIFFVCSSLHMLLGSYITIVIAINRRMDNHSKSLQTTIFAFLKTIIFALSLISWPVIPLIFLGILFGVCDLGAIVEKGTESCSYYAVYINYLAPIHQYFSVLVIIMFYCTYYFDLGETKLELVNDTNPFTQQDITQYMNELQTEENVDTEDDQVSTFDHEVNVVTDDEELEKV